MEPNRPFSSAQVGVYSNHSTSSTSFLFLSVANALVGWWCTYVLHQWREEEYFFCRQVACQLTARVLSSEVQKFRSQCCALSASRFQPPLKFAVYFSVCFRV